jgi:hypothetical protein
LVEILSLGLVEINPLRIDSQHGFLPPAQDAMWLGTILERNRFTGSVWLVDDFAEAVRIAGEWPYIRAMIPREVVRHPLVRSVYGVAPEKLPEGMALEWPAERLAEVAHVRDRRVALDGVPEGDGELPDNFYLKLTGFHLPVNGEQRERMARAMRMARPERVMFASGWPAGGVTWKERLAAFTQSLGAMPMAIREQILGGTAAEFYGL